MSDLCIKFGLLGQSQMYTGCLSVHQDQGAYVLTTSDYNNQQHI